MALSSSTTQTTINQLIVRRHRRLGPGRRFKAPEATAEGCATVPVKNQGAADGVTKKPGRRGKRVRLSSLSSARWGRLSSRRDRLWAGRDCRGKLDGSGLARQTRHGRLQSRFIELDSSGQAGQAWLIMPGSSLQICSSARRGRFRGSGLGYKAQL